MGKKMIREKNCAWVRLVKGVRAFDVRCVIIIDVHNLAFIGFCANCVSIFAKLMRNWTKKMFQNLRGKMEAFQFSLRLRGAGGPARCEIHPPL